MDRKIKETWSKYKIVTIILSVLAILTTIFVSIYDQYYNRRWEEINYLSKQLELKRSKLSTPFLDVFVNTLDNGFPAFFSEEIIEEFLNSLPLKPSMIELSHVRGNTAKNITLNIKSSIPIKSFQKVKSIEIFSAEYISSDKRQLRLSVPYLRRDTKIGVILLTDKIPDIDFSLTAEIGELFDLDKEASESEKSLEEIIKIYGIDNRLIYGRNILTFLGIEDPLPPFSNIISVSNTNLDKEIELIERKVNALRNDNFGKWLLKLILLKPIILIGFAIAVAMCSSIGLDFLKDRKRKIMYDEAIKKIHENEVKIGDSLYEVVKKIGTPNDINILGNREYFILELLYFRIKGAIFYKNLLLSFKFRESALVEISNERNERLV